MENKKNLSICLSILVLLSLFTSSCCSYNEKDLEFNSLELKRLSNYKVGDTLFFQSNFGDIDTLRVTRFGVERHTNCSGFMAPRPSNSKWVEIQHLPNDKWSGTNTSNGKTEVDYQGLFWVSKYPTEKTTEYWVNFKDFSSKSDTVIETFIKIL